MELTNKEKKETASNLRDGDRVIFCPHKNANTVEGIVVEWDDCIYIVQDYFQGCSVPEDKRKGKKYAWVISDALDILYSEIYYISSKINIENKQYLLFEEVV
jgi:hypothetical protein